MKITCTLPNLSAEEVSKLVELSSIDRESLDSTIEKTVRAWIQSADVKYLSSGECPRCANCDRHTLLKAMPALIALEEGLIRIGSDTIKEFIADKNFVFCPSCGWTGLHDNH
jgi:hypothetical protein